MNEQQIHKTVVKHLRQRGAAKMWFTHIPNGGYRRPAEAAILNGMGVTAGAPDLLLVRNGKAEFLELKTVKGKCSDVQTRAHIALTEAGCNVYVASGLDEAIAWLEGRGYLRGLASTKSVSREARSAN